MGAWEDQAAQQEAEMEARARELAAQQGPQPGGRVGQGPGDTTDPFDPNAKAAYGGRNTENANTWQYGGYSTGGASANIGGSPDAYKQMYGGLMGQAGGYQAQAGQQYDQSQAARQSQGDALALQKQAAMGLTPSVAQIQQQQGLDSTLRAQAAMAGGARGAAGLAGAQYNAAMNTGALQQQGIGQASMLRAQEMQNARDAYMQGATGMRGQDLGAYGQAGQFGLGYTGQAVDLARAQQQAQAGAAALSVGQWQAQMGADQNANAAPVNAAKDGAKVVGQVVGGAAKGG